MNFLKNSSKITRNILKLIIILLIFYVLSFIVFSMFSRIYLIVHIYKIVNILFFVLSIALFASVINNKNK